MKSASKANKIKAQRNASVADLMAELALRDQIIEARDTQIQSDQKSIDELRRRIAILEQYYALAKSRHFGKSSEKHPNQADLFNEVELLADVDEADPAEDEEVVTTTRKKTKSSNNKAFNDKLPRVRIELPLSDEEKEGAHRTFFTKVKEELDVVPPKIQILEYWQEKAQFKDPKGIRIVAATRPVHPLGKVKASVRLIAHIITGKYCDALPLYRQESILDRYGGSMTRTAMANWIIGLTDVFMPLLNLIREHQLSHDYLQMDETRLAVLKEPGRSVSSEKWMWVMRGGPPTQPVVTFDYDPSRAGAVVERLLGDFSGTLQTDGHKAYDSVCLAKHIAHIGCWDHARRKFMDAIKAMPTKDKCGKGRKVSKAEVGLSKIRKLYAIERKIKDYTAEQRYAYRQQHSIVILDNLKTWLDDNIQKVAKDSLTFIAIRYSRNQWDKLIGYCAHGDLQISNILAENAIRPFAVGRKNWLFCDTPRGAKASAACYSLIETAKANELEPFAYLHHVLKHIASADTLEKVEVLLPWNVKLAG